MPNFVHKLPLELREYIYQLASDEGVDPWVLAVLYKHIRPEIYSRAYMWNLDDVAGCTI